MSGEQKSGQPGEEELVASNPNANGPDGAAGRMGVSSEREGATGPGQHGTDGQLDTSPGAPAAGDDTPPEHDTATPSTGPGDEPDVNPAPPAPAKAGYNSRDPRSKEKAYQPGPDVGR